MFSFRRSRSLDLEQEFRADRPEPRPEFLGALEARVRAVQSRRPHRTGLRVGIALATASALMAALGATGSLGNAASSVERAVQAVQRIAEPATVQRPAREEVTAGHDQYHRQQLCHNGHTITVDRNAVDAHLAHGDELSPCPTAGDDVVIGGNANNGISTGAGDDRISSGGGNDTIKSGSGNDNVKAGKGNDRVNSGTGSDKVDGGSGNDRIDAGKGKDRINGGPGRDRLFGGPGDDTLNSRDGERDLVNGGPGRDTCIADARDILISCEVVRIR